MEIRRWLVALGVLVAGWTMIGIPAHATYGARVTADEPQYLLSAISLGTDLDLDISDELTDEAYRPFHAVDIDPQTQPLDDDGRQISPHDPLLPMILAIPMRVGGWVAAKATLVLLAAVLAVLTAWVAVRRFGVRPSLAVPIVAAFACTAPLATYATQVYPEIPAALAVMTAVWALTGGRARGQPDPAVLPGLRATALTSVGPCTVFAVAVVGLPWLSIKYAPVAAALALLGLWQLRHSRAAVGLGLALITAGVMYLLVHRAVYGGWTAYASGDFFAGSGEFTVVGTQPNYPGRARRLVGLLVDDGFGIASWMIGWLALPFALGVVLRPPRAPHIATLLVPLMVGWLVATFVALTMHGWWWPGRQLVAVLPLGVIVIAMAAERVAAARRKAVVRLIVAATILGASTWLWTMIEAIGRRRVLVVDFDETANPWMRFWRLLLPDGREPTAVDHWLTLLWTAVLILLIGLGWRWSARAEATEDHPGAMRLLG